MRRNPAKTSVTPTCSILCKTLSEPEKLRKIEEKNYFSVVQSDRRYVVRREEDSCPGSDLNAMSQPMTGTSFVPCSKTQLRSPMKSFAQSSWVGKPRRSGPRKQACPSEPSITRPISLIRQGWQVSCPQTYHQKCPNWISGVSLLQCGKLSSI